MVIAEVPVLKIRIILFSRITATTVMETAGTAIPVRGIAEIMVKAKTTGTMAKVRARRNRLVYPGWHMAR